MAVAPPNAGRMQCRVAVKKPIETRNAGGESVQTWTAIGIRWASIVPTGSIEESYGSGVRSVATYSVRMRYWPELSSSARLEFMDRTGAHTLEIVSMFDVDQRHYEWQCECREVVQP